MENTTPKDPRKWYQKKRYMIPATLIGLSLIFGGDDSAVTTKTNHTNYIAPPTASVVESQTKTEIPTVETKTVEKTETKSVSSPPLSNDNYYTNVNGEKVHSPAYTPDDSIPAGASAKCRDGTYSFSKNRRGTCSHHGGVARWL